MCDFRTITKIKLLAPGDWDDQETILDVLNNTKTIPFGTDLDAIKEIGFYFIPATGSYHAYYDGKKWLYEKTDYRDGGWEVIEYEQGESWQKTHG